VRAGEEAQLGPGEGFLWLPPAVGEFRNDSAEPAVVLVVLLTPQAGTPVAGAVSATPIPVPTSTPVPPPTPEPDLQQAVAIKDFRYMPAELVMSVGSTVTWTNQDSIAHTVTAANGRDGLQSGAMSLGTSYTQAFNEPGTYDYYCEFHPRMRGTLIVKS